MKTQTFTVVLFSVLVVCALLTVAHILYALYAYQHCSIIYFIAKELW